MDTPLNVRSNALPNREIRSKVSLAVSQGVRPGLYLFFMLFLLYFMYLLFHEGGHALYVLARGGKVDIFYVHPFLFSGYVRPIAFFNDPWFHAAGPLLGILGPLPMTLLLWKRRSTSLLPLVMSFPWMAILQGISLLMGGGDTGNIIQLTGISPLVFQLIGMILLCSGMFLFFTLLPLEGFDPRSWKALPNLFAALLFWSGIGYFVGLICVPGSPIAVRYDLAEELLTIARMAPINGAVTGILFGGIYITLFRWIHPHLHNALRSEVALISWRDLRLPGFLAIISVAAGLLIIT